MIFMESVSWQELIQQSKERLESERPLGKVLA